MPNEIMLNPMQVESEIIRLSGVLEERVSDYSSNIQAAAEAEAAWKRAFAQAMIDVIASAGGTRMTVAEREARVELLTTDDHRTHLVCAALAKATKESLNALDSQINALRTLAANQRHMIGGPGA